MSGGGRIEREYGLGRRCTDLLVIFDRTLDRRWEEKIFQRQESLDGRVIGVWGM